MTEVTGKVERAIARFERVTRQLDERGGPAQEAARRERQRLNTGLGRTAIRVAAAVALIWLGTIILGLVKPIGMFGFLAALLVTGVVAAVLIARGGQQAIRAPAPAADLPNGTMVERERTPLLFLEKLFQPLFLLLGGKQTKIRLFPRRRKTLLNDLHRHLHSRASLKGGS